MTMMGSGVAVTVLAAVVVCFACGGSGQAASVVSNAGVSIPNSLVDNLLKAVEPKIDSAINNIALPTCCYDDVGVKHVHLNFQRLSIVNTRVDLNVNTTASTDQLLVEAGIQLTLQGFYRLCLHDDPFGKGCSTLDKCKGDFSVTPALAATLAFKPIVEPSGHLRVDGTLAGFKLLSINNNFCNWFQKGIDAAKPDIIKAGSKALTKAAASAAAALTEVANGSFNTSAARVDWLFSNITHTTSKSAAAMLDVELTTPSGVRAPYKQASQPPLSELTDDDVHVVLGDSLLSNSLFVLAKDGLLDFHTDIDVGNSSVPVNISFSGASDVRFKEQAAFDLNTTVAFTLFNKPITANAVLTAAFTLKVNSSAPHTYNVTIHATEATLSSIGQCSDEAACNVLKAVKKFLDKSGASMLNKLLAGHPIVVSDPHLSDLRAVVGDSFVDVALGLDFTALAQQTVDMLHAEVLGGIQCPQIPGAHQDGCI